MKGEYRTRSRRSMSDINVVPYIDVMLVLLIIFMVTAPMITPSIIDLPSISQTEAPNIANNYPIEVSVRQVGLLQVKDLKTNSIAEVSLENLASTVIEFQGENKKRPVVISAEKKIEYQSVVDTMDALQKASIEKVGLLVQSEPGKK